MKSNSHLSYLDIVSQCRSTTDFKFYVTIIDHIRSKMSYELFRLTCDMITAPVDRRVTMGAEDSLYQQVKESFRCITSDGNLEG